MSVKTKAAVEEVTRIRYNLLRDHALDELSLDLLNGFDHVFSFILQERHGGA